VNGNGHVQLKVKNYGTNGSGDLVVEASNGSETSHYIDTGMNDSAYPPTAPYLGTTNDGYIIVVGNTTNATTEPGGSLYIQTLQSNSVIVMAAGINGANNPLIITSTNIIGNGSGLTNVPIWLATNNIVVPLVQPGYSGLWSSNGWLYHITAQHPNGVLITAP
jgi:hypothetical protein